MRLDGYEPVFFLTGTDEHGIKMLQDGGPGRGLTPARARRIRNVQRFQAHGGAASSARTTTTSGPPRKRPLPLVPRRSGERMAKAGDIYLSKYSGWYSVRDEALLRRR